MPTVPADQLSRAILEAVIWLDGVSYPPTINECWCWLVRSANQTAIPADVAEKLTALVSSGWLITQDDQFALVGRQEIFALRQQRQKFSERKLRRAKFFARSASWLPFVRLVAVTSKLSYNNASDDSDIDLFIVSSSKTLWTTRLILAGCLHLLRLRPEPGRMRDALCLSFLVDENHLNLGRFALPESDPDLRWWAATLRPLYDAGNIASKYYIANKSWVGEWLPNAFKESSAKPSQPSHNNFFQRQLISLAQFFEPNARRLQERWFPAVIRQLKNLDTRVVVESGVLKFHVTDRRAEYRQKYQARLQELGLRQTNPTSPVEVTKEYAIS